MATSLLISTEDIQFLKLVRLGLLTTSEKSKQEKILPLGLTDNAILKKDINKDQTIKLDDVELNLPKEVVEARDYQYNLI